jgi:leucyl aminopeptidase
MTAVFDSPTWPNRRRTISFSAGARVPEDCELVGVLVAPGAKTVRLPGGGTISGGYLSRRGFEAKTGQGLHLPGDDGPVVMAVGLGTDQEGPVTERLRLAAAGLVRSAGPARTVALVPGSWPEGVDPRLGAQAVGEGAALATYRYAGFKSAPPAAAHPEHFVLVGSKPRELLAGLERGSSIASAVALVRDLVNEPSGSLTPSRMADIASELAGSHGLGITVLGPAEIEAEGLGGLAGVASGSQQEARLVRLEYNPARGGSTPTVALVGKGITFDSGGLSLKSGEGMMTMKDDMAGAAVVIGTMSLLEELGVGVRVIGFTPLTENMPSGTAVKPGDVLRARNGKTIEVLNTDAEGRLVLADGLSLAAEEKPDAIIDLATLTGAVVSALGRQVAGVMGNNHDLLVRVEQAADQAGERVWRLPLPPDYRRDIDSEVADMKNIGNPGQAGSIIAGLFLQEFVDGRPWAHLDIAGTAYGDRATGYCSKGATGYGVRLLISLLESMGGAASA